jgi:hypothetical protein
MQIVVIKRCPYCPSIGSQAKGIAKALGNDLNVYTQIEDGVKGELSVFVDGVPVIQRTSDDLPSSDEVEAAVKNAAPVGV